MTDLLLKIKGDNASGIKAIKDTQDGVETMAESVAQSLRQVNTAASNVEGSLGGIRRQAAATAASLSQPFSEAQREISRTATEAERGAKRIGESGASGAKIAREAFTSAASEIIESWGVDGDIANEVAKGLQSLPGPAKLAVAAIVVELAAAGGATLALVESAKQVLEVSEKIGTKSKDDFQKYKEELKSAGFEVTKLDQVLGQQLNQSAKNVQITLDGMFLSILRQSGPGFITFLNAATQLLRDMQPVANVIGQTLTGVFFYASTLAKALPTIAREVKGYKDDIFSGDLLAPSTNLAARGKRITDALTVAQVQATADYIKILGNAQAGEVKFSAEGSKGRQKAISELEQLAKRLSEVQQETALLQGRALATPEYLLKLRIDGAEEFRNQLKEVQKLQAELGISSASLNQANGTKPTGTAVDRLFDREKAKKDLESLKAIKDQGASADPLTQASNDYLKELDAKIKTAGLLLSLRQGQAQKESETADKEKKAAEFRQRAAIQIAEIAKQTTQSRIAGLGDGQQTDTVRQRLALQQQAIENERTLITTRITAEIAANQASVNDDQITAEKKAEIRRLLTDQLIAEEQRLAEATNAIKLLQESNEATAGVQRLNGLSALISGLRTPFKLLSGQVQGFAENLALAGINAIASGQSIGQAMRAAARSTIAAIAQIAGVEAIKNVGYALNAMGYTIFTGDPRGAAAASHYWGAAAAWGGIALGAAVGASLIGGGGNTAGAAGGGAYGNALTGTNQNNNQPQETRFINSERDRDGRTATNVIITLKTEPGQFVQNVEKALVTSFGNDGAARRIIRNEVNGEPLSA